MDRISHLYYIILDIKELQLLFQTCMRKIKIVNLYDNKVGESQL